MDWAERYIGGKGLLLRYMWEYVPPRVDPWAPENPVFLVTGPFAGTNVSTASRLVVGAKSPATGILDDSYVGGSFAPEMKFAGYDLIIITGQGRCSPRCSGSRTTRWSSSLPRASTGGSRPPRSKQPCGPISTRTPRSLSIGPAGENLVPWACLSTDQFHKAGRGGHGALFGSKNLKAVAIRGTGSVRVGDARAFLADMARIHKEHVLTDFNLWANEEGTPILVDPVNGAGALPTRNWSAGSFEGAAGHQLRGLPEGQGGQPGLLPVRHRLPPGARGRRRQGRRTGVRDHRPVRLQLRGGRSRSADALQPRVRRVGSRHHLLRLGGGAGHGHDRAGRRRLRPSVWRGRRLRGGAGPDRHARGRRGGPCSWVPGRLAAKYGVPELAMEVKNLELPGYDPRGAFGMSLSYATSDRGGCHMRTYPIADEVLEGTRPADSMEGKAEQVIKGNVANGFIGQNFSSIKFSGIWCDFWAVDPDQLGQMFKHVWKREFTEDEIMLIGERIWNLGRLFNLREGVEADSLPRKLYATECGLQRRTGGREGHRRGGLASGSRRSTTGCAVGTRPACPPRPSWPRWAWTCGCGLPGS